MNLLPILLLSVILWRSGVNVSIVAPQAGRHTIHSYFNTCPESPNGKWALFFASNTADAQRVFFKLATPAGGDARSSKASTRLRMVAYDLQQKRFLFASARWGHPAWHPNSRTIIESGNLLIDSETGKTERIPVLPSFGTGHPSVSPDGRASTTTLTQATEHNSALRKGNHEQTIAL